MSREQSIVIIVDDDQSIRHAVRRLMKSLCAKVETFASAEDFLRSNRLDSTACLILDMHMPGLSGLELQRQLIAAGRNIPIIFITAFTNERANTEALRAGAVSYLIKPFDDEILLNQVDQVLKQQGHDAARI